MKKKLKTIYKKIKKYPVIFIARHVGPDPDALAAQFALKDAIMLTFPSKKVITTGVAPARFRPFGKNEDIDAVEEIDKKKALLLVVDTPDIKRIDGINIEEYGEVIKIDHHPVIDVFGPLDYVDTSASSASEIVASFLIKFKLKIDRPIAEKLFKGIVFDTGRFMHSSTSSKTFKIISQLIELTKFDVSEQYDELYMREYKIIRFFGFVAEHLSLTENGLGYIRIPSHIFTEFGVDLGACGNVAERLNHISDLLVWVIFAEDQKNEMVKVTIRSRGPVINLAAENHGGGGHPLASGVRYLEAHIDDPRIDDLIEELDLICENYQKEV